MFVLPLQPFFAEYPCMLDKRGEENFEILLEQTVIALQKFGGFFHVRYKSRAFGHAAERAVNALNGSIAQQPVVLFHVGKHKLYARRKQQPVPLKQTVDALHIGFQRFVGIIAPVGGQNMIVEHIGNNARIMVEMRTQPVFAFRHRRMRIGKIVDGAVHANALLHRFGESGQAAPLHCVANEIAYQQRLAVTRKIKVCEEIHFAKGKQVQRTK